MFFFAWQLCALESYGLKLCDPIQAKIFPSVSGNEGDLKTTCEVQRGGESFYLSDELIDTFSKWLTLVRF